jgi:5-methylcytosine-specific restriction enzyme A
MPRALKVCSRPGCPNLVGSGRCGECRGQAERQRGTARQRGYDRQHETRFRDGVLRRQPRCVCDDQTHGHGPRCDARSVVADHHPRSRRELVVAGDDPNDPRYGRGLCRDCDPKQTAQRQPGGWNVR